MNSALFKIIARYKMLQTGRTSEVEFRAVILANVILKCGEGMETSLEPSINLDRCGEYPYR